MGIHALQYGWSACLRASLGMLTRASRRTAGARVLCVTILHNEGA
jgi:hypothetical protein